LVRLTRQQRHIDLDRITSYNQQRVNRPGGGMQIAISRARLEIDRQSRQLDLQLEDVRVADADGEPFAAFPEMTAGFSLNSLLQGKLAPTRIVIERSVLHLVRDQAGAMRF